uniref:Uncharacterized protein n=2 Tax=Picea TaxID=3328 RepID=A0A101LXN7_PICGL|nr:hypothetical protein ABT39_MTgene5446 [Picea glauca]QHR91506.1 hypothetical protein Q903MT_gene5541 [Picea sitchensis]
MTGYCYDWLCLAMTGVYVLSAMYGAMKGV